MLVICIPARNECQTLPRLIENIVRLPCWLAQAGQRQIVICVNASTDGTDKVAKALAVQHPDIRVCKEEMPGKNFAWQKLLREVDPYADNLFFIDADISLENETIPELQRALQDYRYDIVSGLPIPKPPWTGKFTVAQHAFAMLQRSVVVREIKERLNSIHGGCYGIRRDAAWDFSIMLPKESVVGDDTPLNWYFAGRKKMVPTARFHYVPPRFVDLILVRTRIARRELILFRRYPEMYRFTIDQSVVMRRRFVLKNLFRLSPGAILGLLVNAAATFLGRAYARLRPQPTVGGWISPQSTKR